MPKGAFTSSPIASLDAQPVSLCLRLPDAQYTLILPASKNLPSQTVDFLKGRTFHRKSVGVRVSSEPVCQVCTACVMAARLQFRPV